MFKCKKCGSETYRLEQKGTATGLYCADCGFWHQWLGKEDLKRYQAGLKESELSAAEFEALKAENENLKKELSLAKSFHDLACKERDLERYRVDKLSAVNAELKARIEKAVELPLTESDWARFQRLTKEVEDKGEEPITRECDWTDEIEAEVKK